MPSPKKLHIYLLAFILTMGACAVFAQQEDIQDGTIFDDKRLLEGYAKKYADKNKEILFEIIKDDNLNHYKMAAAVRVFREKYSQDVFSREKIIFIKYLLRRLNRTDSPFVQIETMATLTQMNRYKYFKTMVPDMILKLDHYNDVVNEVAFENLDQIIKSGSNRPTEARIVFNTLRKVLFLSRKHLAEIDEPDTKLKNKLTILRWSIKVLGSQELRRLPKEVISLL